jgi:hypothetical protein
MTVTQRGIPSAEHERGVPNAFARLEELIELSRASTDVGSTRRYDEGESHGALRRAETASKAIPPTGSYSNRSRAWVAISELHCRVNRLR